MGCDIHGFLEWKRFKGDDGWFILGIPPDDRWYDTFAVLAGVRNYVEGLEPIAEKRGVPDDASYETKEEVEKWGVDGHSHTWLTIDDIDNYDWNQVVTDRDGVQVRASMLLTPNWVAFINYMRELSRIHGKNKVRLIIWFDN